MGANNHAARVLIFTAGASADAARRRLLPARVRSAETAFFDGCFRQVRLAAGTLETTVCSPRQLPVAADLQWQRQQAGPFGARLQSAVGEAFSRSPAALIVVGTDTPDLSGTLFERALSALADPDVIVLGPSLDGGVYLIAGARSFAELLAPVRWCSRHAFADLVRSATKAGRRVVVLEALHDVDDRQGLLRWLAFSPASVHWATIQRSLRTILRMLASSASTPRVDLQRRSLTFGIGIRPPPPLAFV